MTRMSERYKKYYLSMPEEERSSYLRIVCENEVAELMREYRNENQVLNIFLQRYRELELDPPLAELRRIVAAGAVIAKESRDKQLYDFDEVAHDLRPSSHLAKRIQMVKSWKAGAAFILGIDELDAVYGGVLPGEMLAITGAQGAMKTSLVLGAVERALADHKRVSFFSLDMSPQEIMERRLLLRLECSQRELHERIRNNDESIALFQRDMMERDLDLFQLAGNDGEKRWLIDAALKQVLLHRSEILVIDYLTLMKAPGVSDLECAEEIMPKLKNFVQRNQIAAILLNQMSRASKRDQNTGNIGGHGKGGGIIEETVHSEIELFKDAPDYEEQPDKIIATVTKSRRGRTRISFALDYIPSCLKFTGLCSRVVRDAQKSKPVFRREQGFR